MKIPFSLKNLLAAVAIASTIGTTLAETTVTLNHQAKAQISSGNVISEKSYLQSHRVTGSGDFYLSGNMKDDTSSLDLTTTNIWLETENELRLSGVEISNSVEKEASGYTGTAYGILVANGKVIIDNIKTGDLQANLSIGTDLGSKKAELVISGGAEVTTSAIYNTIGANGSQGTISISDANTTFNTQQITLGSTRSLHANSQVAIKKGGAMNLNGVRALVTAETWEQETEDGASQGYGIINISDGASMHVGEGNTNDTASNKLQIINGQLNVKNSGSALIMHDNATISMTGGYGDNEQPDITAGLYVTDGGVVKNAEGAKINNFTMGHLYGTHDATSTLSVDGAGSAVQLDVSGGVYLGLNQESGNGTNKVILRASNSGTIALNSDSWCMLGENYYMTGDNTSGYDISVTAESGGSVQLSGSSVAIGGGYADKTSRGNIILKASGTKDASTTSLDIRATNNIYLNRAQSSDLSISLVAESGAALSLQAGKNINICGDTKATITDEGSSLKTSGTVRLYNTSSVSIGSDASWESTGAITLNDSASLILSEGASVQAVSVTINEGASLSIISEDTAEAAVVFGMGVEEAALVATATIDADLILENGAMVTLDGASIDMNGHSLTMGDNISITLSGDALNSDEYVLFTNLGNTDAENTEIELTINGQKTTAVYSGKNVVVNAASIPEPTTATLSLLALTALAARRRRK